MWFLHNMNTLFAFYPLTPIVAGLEWSVVLNLRNVYGSPYVRKIYTAAPHVVILVVSRLFTRERTKYNIRPQTKGKTNTATNTNMHGDNTNVGQGKEHWYSHQDAHL